MRDLYIGTMGHGMRVHLAGVTEDGQGFSRCGRRMRDISTLDQCRLKVDDPWCGSCLNAEVRQAVSWAELDYLRAQRGEGLFRCRADERSPVGNDGGDA
jgi:hypothetical protein